MGGSEKIPHSQISESDIRYQEILGIIDQILYPQRPTTIHLHMQLTFILLGNEYT